MSDPRTGRRTVHVTFDIAEIKQVNETDNRMSVEGVTFTGWWHDVPIATPYNGFSGFLGVMPVPGSFVVLLNASGHGHGMNTLRPIPVAYLSRGSITDYLMPSKIVRDTERKIHFSDSYNLQQGNALMASTQGAILRLSNIISMATPSGNSFSLYPDDKLAHLNTATFSQSLSGVRIRAGFLYRKISDTPPLGGSIDAPTLRTLFFPNVWGKDIYSELDAELGEDLSDTADMDFDERPLSEYNIKLWERASFVTPMDDEVLPECYPKPADVYDDPLLKFVLGTYADDLGNIPRHTPDSFYSENTSTSVRPTPALLTGITTGADMHLSQALHFSLENDSGCEFSIDKDGKYWIQSGASDEGSAFSMFFRGSGDVYIQEDDDHYSLKITTEGQVYWKVGKSDTNVGFRVNSDGHILLTSDLFAEFQGSGGVLIHTNEHAGPRVRIGGKNTAGADATPAPIATGSIPGWQGFVLDKMMKMVYNTHIHNTAIGPTLPPMPPFLITAISGSGESTVGWTLGEVASRKVVGTQG